MSEVKIHRANTVSPITLTDTAKAHLISCLSKHPSAIGLRFSVKKAGCSGLSYVIDYIDTEDKMDVSFSFSEHYRAYIDSQSYQYIQGMTVDYVKDGFGSKLIFINPNQTGQCGCGESFTV